MRQPYRRTASEKPPFDTLLQKKPQKFLFDYHLIRSLTEFKKIINMPYLYLLGMSVPPVMMAQIATNIYEQCLKNTPSET